MITISKPVTPYRVTVQRRQQQRQQARVTPRCVSRMADSDTDVQDEIFEAVMDIRLRMRGLRKTMMRQEITLDVMKGLGHGIASVDEALSDLPPSDYTEIFRLKEEVFTFHQWINEVNTWFVKAQELKKWIEDRFNHVAWLLEPMDVNLLTLEHCRAEIAYLEAFMDELDHKKANTITNLKKHVRQATDASNKLNPAETATVAITLDLLKVWSKLCNAVSNRIAELKDLQESLLAEEATRKEHDSKQLSIDDTKSDDGRVTPRRSRLRTPSNGRRLNRASVSPSPTPHPPKGPNHYKPVKTDRLDIEIGNIVNEQSFAIDMSMGAHGGLYRIGNKLCFCRILNSSVMVRVGGGWQELEEFLHDRFAKRGAGSNVSSPRDEITFDFPWSQVDGGR